MSVRGTKETEFILSKMAPREALNLTRATVGAMAGELVADAKGEMSFGRQSRGNMRRSVKRVRRQVRNGIVQEDVTVGRRAFYWRFWEYGQRVARRAMFHKAVTKLENDLAKTWERLFLKKLQDRLARERRRRLRGVR